jgi:L-serine dehydratase
MDLSIFDIFKIGIGPSSSHTVGPMRAANFLLTKLKKHSMFERVAQIRCELYGSLASTGRGHHTDRAVIWGLQGEEPETIDPDLKEGLFEKVVSGGELMLGGEREIDFVPDRDIVFRPDELLPFHPNGMLFTVFDTAGEETPRDRTVNRQEHRRDCPHQRTRLAWIGGDRRRSRADPIDHERVRRTRVSPAR